MVVGIGSEKNESFESMIREFAALVFSFCFRMTGDYFAAEDLAQETFLSAFKAYETFDGRSPKAWLMKIASGKCCDYLKSAARRTVPAADEELEAVGMLSPPPDDEVFRRMLTEDVRCACETLKEPYRSTALSYYIEDKPLSLIARERGEPLKTVQTRAFRARLMLKNKLKEVI